MMSALLDEELTLQERRGLDAHIRSCPACQAEWASLRALDALLSRAGRTLMPAPARLRDRVQQRLTRQQQARRTLVGTLVLALGTSALLLLVFGPTLLRLVSAAQVLPTLAAGGPETIYHLLTYWRALAQTALDLLGRFGLPLAALGATTLGLAIASNLAWLQALRQLRATR
jgi:anti-sigma factor RsiW